MMNEGVSLYILLILTGTALMWTSCVSVQIDEELSDYEDQLASLAGRLDRDPDNVEALRELGVIYTRTDHPDRGIAFLEKAHERAPDDPKILFYYGLASEMVGNEETALRLYERYPELPRASRFRNMMEGRYEWLERKIAREEVRELLAREEEIGEGRIQENTVAVFPFVYRGDEERYAPLGRGLAEMVVTDLSSVEALTLVERVRLQALLNEMKLARTEFVDSATAPRMGRLLGAGQIVSGSYNVLAEQELRIDPSLAEVELGSMRVLNSHVDALDRLFSVQIQLVFDVVEELGIALTPQEESEIESVPTENLQAFLAYSRGLVEEDRGNFGAAAEFFERAHQLDPGFDGAAEQAEINRGLSAMSGSVEDTRTTAARVEGPPQAGVSSVDRRTETLNASIRSNFVPGQDRRNPAQEVTGTELPEPPRPPAEN